MSNPRVKIIDTQNNNEPVEIDDLTELALGDLIWQCDQLKDELTEARAHEIDKN